ncbi:beta-lactamase domain-containing protein [Methanofollis liminatans DSM 4140]|uniref:Beta-lactamase domain-containing protein n=2 Tax=Methanofollis liminatans TaxID=2201 RepID=J1AQW8_9EURY|nr:beta-lactamase domain-containing protein [Methanofollis liminatans DSM 4140]
MSGQMEGDWIEIPGSGGAYVLPFTRYPDVCCSNAYVVKTPGEILVIDTGADEAQIASLAAAVRAANEERPCPAFVLLTHCHLDHAYGVIGHREWIESSGIAILAQEEGAVALEGGDPHLTVAEMYGREIGPVPVDVHLLTADDRARGGERTVEARGRSVRLAADRVQVEGETALHRQRITFPSGAECTVYHLPGHSPDSIFVRIGEHLFIGDILFAASPGIAGLHRWNCGDLCASARSARQILASGEIGYCWNGHGRGMTVPDTLRALSALERETKKLDGICAFDPVRLNESVCYARDLLLEAGKLFSVIGGRLYYLSYYLEELGEEEEAEKYRDLLQNDAIDEFLTNFSAFAKEVGAGKKLEIQFVLKAVQIAGKIERALGAGASDPVLDASLVRRARHLLTDCLSTVYGLDERLSGEEIDLAECLERFVTGFKDPSRLDEAMVTAVEDESAFLAALAARIASPVLFEETAVGLEVCTRPLPVMTDPERLCDGITSLIEDFAAAGAKEVKISVAGTPDGAAIAVTSDALHPDWPYAGIYERRFSRCRGRCAVEEGDGEARVVVCFRYGDDGRSR